MSIIDDVLLLNDVTRVNDKILFENHSIIVEATKEFPGILGFLYRNHMKYSTIKILYSKLDWTLCTVKNRILSRNRHAVKCQGLDS